MSFILNNLTTAITPFVDRPLWVAYSGGVDSQVLLYALAELKQSRFPNLSLNVCHVHHGLSENADYWQQFAEDTCKALNIPLVCQRVKLTIKPRQSIEAVAREARYQVFKDTCPENAVIVTGHHQEDQWETFLLALKRGSGVQGLGAMQKVSELGNANQLLCRPLLDVPKQAIYEFADDCSLTWIEDESNQDEQFDRNFIRHQLTPMLRNRWPAFVNTVARSAQHCQDAQQIITEVAEQDLTQTLSTNGRVVISKLLTLSIARQKQVLRQLIQHHSEIMPSLAQIEQVLDQIQQAKLSTLAVKLGQVWLRHFQGELYITNALADVSQWRDDISLPSHGETTLNLPDGLGQLVISREQGNNNVKTLLLSLPTDVQQLTVKFKHDNPKVLPDYRQHHRSLKKIWQELAIPTWQRNRIPLLFCDNDMVAAAGQFVCQPFKQTDCRQTYYLSWLACRESG